MRANASFRWFWLVAAATLSILAWTQGPTLRTALQSLLKPLMPPSRSSWQPRQPLEYYQQLHSRPAQAMRRGAADAYPLVQWPQYDDSRHAPPTDEQLLRHNNGSSGYAQASNPTMVVGYVGWPTSFFGERQPTHRLDCAVPCVMSSNIKTFGKRADVLVFHAPTLDWEGFWSRRKPERQLWALHSMESEQSYTVQQAASPVMKRVDIQASYKLSGVLPHLYNIPTPYLNKGEYSNLFRPRRPQVAAKTRLALWMHNNCKALSARQLLVAQLMQLLPVDSPGSCLNNMDARGLNATAPVELMGRYKFYFVFENVFDDPDWVSSTFFRCLEAGTVPVVIGAPNVLKFAPGRRSMIRACDFDSAAQLADYLLYLDSNDTAYREYLSWMADSPSPEFASLSTASDVSPWCRMCIAAAQRHPEVYDAKHRQRLEAFEQARAAFAALNAQLDDDAAVQCKGATAWWHFMLPDDDQNIYIEHDHSVAAGPGDEAAAQLLAAI